MWTVESRSPRPRNGLSSRIRPALVALQLVTFISVATDDNDHYERREYCQWETFNASCRAEDEVVLMQEAFYGRMRFGRCMRENHGSVGCSANVLEYLDQRCSGRRFCSITIPDASLHSNLQCPKEVMPYLEASYTCVAVKSGNKETCSILGGQLLRNPVGYIQPLSFIHVPDPKPDTGGTPTCPWLIQTHQGQRLNLTLISFQRENNDARDLTRSGRSKCSTERVVVVDGNRSLELTLCAERSREKHLYLSEGNSIQMHLDWEKKSAVEQPAVLENGNFLIKYQVVGCPDIVDFVNGWVMRRADTAIVRCNFTGETFFLTCIDTRWKGELSRCTPGDATRTSYRVEARKPAVQSRGLLVVIAMGVAIGVAIGVFVLFSVVICHRRRRKYQQRRYYAGERLLADSLGGQGQDHHHHPHPDHDRKGVLYAPIWAQPTAAAAAVAAGCSGACRRYHTLAAAECLTCNRGAHLPQVRPCPQDYSSSNNSGGGGSEKNRANSGLLTLTSPSPAATTSDVIASSVVVMTSSSSDDVVDSWCEESAEALDLVQCSSSADRQSGL